MTLPRLSPQLYFAVWLSFCIVFTLLLKQKRNVVPTIALVILTHGLLSHANRNFYITWGAAPATRSEAWANVAEAIDFMVKQSGDQHRLIIHESATMIPDIAQFTGTMAIFKGLSTFSFYQSPRLYWKLIAENWPPRELASYGMLAGRYALSRADLSSPFELVATFSDLKLYRNATAVDRVVSLCWDDVVQSGLAPNSVQLNGRLPSVDANTARLIEAALRNRNACGQDAGIISTRDPRTNTLRWTMEPGPARLVAIQLPPLLGWQLSINGKSTPIYSVLDRHIVAIIPGGERLDVALTYNPWYYWRRLRFALMGVVALAAFAAVTAWWRWRSPKVGCAMPDPVSH